MNDLWTSLNHSMGAERGSSLVSSETVYFLVIVYIRMDEFTTVCCLNPVWALQKPIKNKECMPYDAL